MASKYQMVNWVDGMKIRRQHFVDQQRAFSQQAMHSVSSQLNAINYGLQSPVSPQGGPSYKVNVEIENTKTIHVKILACQATTPGGFYIDIGEESGQPKQLSISLPEDTAENDNEQYYQLVLSASPFEPNEVGDPDPEEVPPRRPYTEPAYQLGLFPKQAGGAEISNYGSLDLAIGEIIVNSSNQVRINEQYIPPSMAVYSFPRLIDMHTEFHHSLRKLETLCVQIIRKIVAKQQEYQLAIIVHQLSEDILAFLGSMLYRFNWTLRYAPPIYMVESIASLARLIRNAINIHQGVGKEELINYFVEWCDINQGEFEKVISQLVDHEYDHTAIAASMAHCSRFLDEIVGLYAKLDELDYIGRKAEKDIFVKEEKRNQKSKKKKRINFLAQ